MNTMLIKNIPIAFERMEILNKRCRKLGLSPVNIVFGEKVDRDHIEFEITGEMPVLKGWRLLAVLNHADADEIIVNVVPGEELPEKYRESYTCEHCNTNRYRKDTFVVQHENGEYKQVGRQCLADFIGDTDPHRWLQISLLFMDIYTVLVGCDEHEWGYSSSILSFNLHEFLVSAECAIWAFGWANSESDWPTWRAAIDLLRGHRETCEMYEDEVSKRNNGAKREPIVDIKKVIEWAENLSDNDCIEHYFYNLRVIAQSGYVTMRTVGYAASMIMTYQREQAKKLELEQAAKQSKHFGTVGKREIFELFLDRVIVLENYYGITFLHLFHDKAGNKAVWFSTSKCLHENEKLYKIKATVKSHTEHDSVKQTVLTRCKVV